MKRNPDDLHINVHGNQSGRDSREVVESYKFEFERQWTYPTKQTPPEGKINILLCKECGHRDFNEDGRFMNEYSCNGCDAFVEVVLK